MHKAMQNMGQTPRGHGPGALSLAGLTLVLAGHSASSRGAEGEHGASLGGMNLCPTLRLSSALLLSQLKLHHFVLRAPSPSQAAYLCGSTLTLFSS